MTLKNAALFAIVGTALWTILLAIDLIRTFSGVVRGFIPDVTLLASAIQFVTGLSLLVFFVVYRRSQS